MYFTAEYTIRQFWVRPGDSIDLDVGGTHKIHVSLRPPSEEDQARGYRAENAVCSVRSQREPNERVRGMFEQLAKRELPKGGRRDGLYKRYFEDDGSLLANCVLPRSMMPQPLASFMTTVADELLDYASRTVRILRWRGNVSGPHNPFSVGTKQWSLDGGIWWPLPTDTSLYMDQPTMVPSSESVLGDVMAMVKANALEPVAHAMFREAMGQRYANPRSALVIGISAAEVAVKQLVGTFVPKASWLVEEIPTPPLIRMLTEYLPSLPLADIGAEGAPFPTALTDVLRDAVATRNNVVHKGADFRDLGALERMLNGVQDLLWLLDSYAGQAWAIRYISSATRLSLGMDAQAPSQAPVA